MTELIALSKVLLWHSILFSCTSSKSLGLVSYGSQPLPIQPLIFYRSRAIISSYIEINNDFIIPESIFSWKKETNIFGQTIS